MVILNRLLTLRHIYSSFFLVEADSSHSQHHKCKSQRSNYLFLKERRDLRAPLGVSPQVCLGVGVGNEEWGCCDGEKGFMEISFLQESLRF